MKRSFLAGALALATCTLVVLLLGQYDEVTTALESVKPHRMGIETHALKEGEKKAAAAEAGAGDKAPAVAGKPSVLPPVQVAPKVAPVEAPTADAEGDFPAMAERFSKGVVQIMVVKANYQWLAPQKPPRTEEVSGSGFFIENKHLGAKMAESKDLHIVTNAHVAMDAVQITIRLPKLGLAPVTVSVVGLSPPEEHDIALLRVDPADVAKLTKSLKADGMDISEGLIRLPIGDSDATAPGEKLMALGYPEGMPGVKSTLGVMSGYQEMSRKLYMQMTTPINPGNSGGPLLSKLGEVIGINTAGIQGSENIGFSIPSAVLKAVLPVLIAHRVFVRPIFGIVLNPTIDDEGVLFGMPPQTPMEGEYISKVYEGTVAHQAGLQAGDVLVSVDGMNLNHRGQMMLKAIHTFVSLDGYLGRTPLGNSVSCVVWRQHKQLTLALPYEITPDLPIPWVYEAALEGNTPPHQIAGGLVFAELTQNFVKTMTSPVIVSATAAQVPAPQLIKYSRYPDDRKESKVVVVDVVSSSLAENTKAFDSAMIVEKVNHIKVRTMPQLCHALAHPVQDQAGHHWLMVEGEDGELGTMRMDALTQNDKKLEALQLYKRTSCQPSKPPAPPADQAVPESSAAIPTGPKTKGSFWKMSKKGPPHPAKNAGEHEDPKDKEAMLEMETMGDGEEHMERMQDAMDRGYSFSAAHALAKLPSMPSMAETLAAMP